MWLSNSKTTDSMTEQINRTTAARTANMGLTKADGLWLSEVLCFYFTLVVVDRFVLLNTRHRQAPNRYASL